MEIKIEKGHLVISIPVNAPLAPSKSLKSLIVASTNGNVTTALKVEGKPVVIGLNAYISR